MIVTRTTCTKNTKNGSTWCRQMLCIWERNQHDQRAQHDPPVIFSYLFQNIPTTDRIPPLHTWIYSDIFRHIDTDRNFLVQLLSQHLKKKQSLRCRFNLIRIVWLLFHATTGFECGPALPRLSRTNNKETIPRLYQTLWYPKLSHLWKSCNKASGLA